jgi:hypothetical protein
MARRVELGAGIAAGVLAVLAFIVILLAPLATYCTVATSGTCPRGAIRNESLLAAGPSAGVWAFLLGVLLVMLVGAAGAVSEARFGMRRGALLLWGGTLVAFLPCALTPLGIFYLPAVVALLLASYASTLRRVAARRALSAQAPGASPEDESEQDT